MVTTFLAIYGAVLSTLAVLVALLKFISDKRAKTPRLDVTRNLGIHQGKDAIFVTAINRGEKAIALKCWSIQTIQTLPNSKDRLEKPKIRDSIFHPSFVISSTGVFPLVLESGRSCDLILDAMEIVGSVGTDHWDKLVVAFEAETGTLYITRPIQVNNGRITY
jgi:hypothetical protein